MSASRIERAAMLALLLFAAALFTGGLRFHLPRHYDASVDAIHPALALEAVDSLFSERHAGGLKYPRLHFLVVGAAQRAWLAAKHGPSEGSAIAAAIVGNLRAMIGAPSLEYRDSFRPWRDDLSDLILLGRAISAAFGIWLVLAMRALARELCGGMAGLVAAFATAASYPVVYYSHTLNVDVPYLAVGVSALFRAARAARTGSGRDLSIASLLAAASIATKDQAAGWFLLAIPLCLAEWTRPSRAERRAFPWKPGLIALGAGAAFYALVQGLPFDVAGFRGHVEHILGSGSESYRRYPADLGGQVLLAKEVVLHLLDAVGIPLLGFALVGVVALARADRRALAWIVLPALSYHFAFQAPIGYTQLRFVLPIALLVLVAAAAGAAALLSMRYVKLPAALALIVALGANTQLAVEVDSMLIEDPQARACEWLAANVAPGDELFAWLELPVHDVELPRAAKVRSFALGAQPPALRPGEPRPQWIVQGVYDSLLTATERDPPPPAVPASFPLYGTVYRRAAVFGPSRPHPLRRGAAFLPTIMIFEREEAGG